MKKVFIYWGNSNIYLAAQGLVKTKAAVFDPRSLRIQFDSLLDLARCKRPWGRVVAAGSIPPDMQKLWDRMADLGVETKLFHRGEKGEEDIPDERLQLRMMQDAVDHLNEPGVVVLLTGDGGFLGSLERIRRLGWQVELLSWEHSCHHGMRSWVERNGIFVRLDDYFGSITFRQYSPGQHQRRPSPLLLTDPLSTRRVQASS